MFWIYFVIYTTILSNSKPYATLFVNQPKPIVIIMCLCVWFKKCADFQTEKVQNEFIYCSCVL